MKENINGIKYGLNQITEDYKKTTNQTKLKFNSKTPENKSVYLIKLQSKYIIPKKTKSQILNIKPLKKSKKEKLNFINVDFFLEYISLKKPFFKNEEDNNNLIEGFCLQHKIFISQEKLINKIISCFDFFYPKKETAIELIKFLNKYINLLSYYNQEELPKEIVQKIFQFLKRIKNYKGIKPTSEEIIQLCEIELKEYEASLKKFSPNPHLITQEKNDIKENIESSSDEEEENNNDNKKIIKDIFLKDAEIIYKKENFFDILKYKSIDIASELTLIKYNLFNKIKVEEFLEGNFNKKEKLNKSPNICEIINRFNKLSLWVKEEILSYDKSKHRAKIIQKFIHICSSLKKLGNFDDLFSILSSLNSYIINKLEKTWKKISKKDLDLFNDLIKIINFGDNLKNLRDEINQRKKNKLFFLPYLGYYTKRILFLEEMGNYLNDSGIINVEKICEIYKVLKEFYEFKKVKMWRYKVKDDMVKNELFILQFLNPTDENSLINIANLLEPKFKLSKKKSKTKILTQTDKNYFSKE